MIATDGANLVILNGKEEMRLRAGKVEAILSGRTSLVGQVGRLGTLRKATRVRRDNFNTVDTHHQEKV